LSGVAAGDRRALEELYCGYHPRLARFLWRFTQQYENTEDIINDTFVVVWRNAAEFRGTSRVSIWIFGIAFRTALSSLRRRKKHTAALAEVECRDQSVDLVSDTEARDWMARGLDRLTLEQRLTLELAYNMGHSLEEIAEISGAPVGTVKARMFHARQELSQYLPALGRDVAEGAACALIMARKSTAER
jgi:RNA polymerase sigma-70 factor (ECF subfamily)